MKQERNRERQRVKKEKWKKPRRKKGRHWEMNKITRFQGKNSVFFCKKTKTQYTKKGWRPTAPKHTCRFFFCCPYGLLMVTYRLRIPCSLQKCHSSCFFYFRCFVFLLFGGCVSFIVSIFVFVVLFAFDFVVFFFLHFSLCDQKTRSNHRISEMLILMFCFGACILAFSLGPAKNPY